MSDKSVIITADRHYLIPALTLFQNILTASNEKYQIEFWFSHLLTETEERLFRKLTWKLNQGLSLSYYRQNEVTAPGYKYLTSGAWIRLSAMDKLRPNQNTIIYLDCDVFLKFGWDKFAQAIPKGFNGLYARKTSGHGNFESKFPSQNNSPYYFNSGVLLFGANWWFDRSYNSVWKLYLKKYTKFGFKTLDQDLLNYMIRDQYTNLPIEFNSYPSEVKSSTRIIHFAGSSKPWGFFQIRFKHSSKLKKKLLLNTEKAYKSNLNIVLFSIFRFGGVSGLKLIIKFFLRFTVMNLKNRFRIMKSVI